MDSQLLSRLQTAIVSLGANVNSISSTVGKKEDPVNK